MENVKLTLRGSNGIFATRLRNLMAETKEKSKITQEELATILGVTRQSVSQYMDGSVVPSTEKLYLISEYFNVSIDYLLGKIDVKSTDYNIRAINVATVLNQISIENLSKWKKESNVL